MKINSTLLLLLLTFGFSTLFTNEVAAKSSNQVIKLTSTIVGTKEQPRFLSIVPWKKLASPVIKARGVNSALFDRLPTITPEQITMKKDLTHYLKARYVKKIASTK